jgi:hypothetical protein
MRARGRTVSIPQWATLAGLADDERSLAVARTILRKDDGPDVVKVRRRVRYADGVRLTDHTRWIRKTPWAKFLAADARRTERK